MFYDNQTHRLQTYVLMSWNRIDFYGSRLRSWSFLCVTFHDSLFVHALWVFTSKISQTSLGIHPKPKTSFCDQFLVHNPIWVWSKILDGDSNIHQDYGIYTYFSSHSPSLLCSRTSIVQAWGRSHYIISSKCYVSIMLKKFLRRKTKNEKLWCEEKKSKEKRKNKVRKKRKREKWEGNKIKVKNIIKMLLSSFCFISSQVSWWQIHTQIFQPCAIR
jgi:hypothetical protein